MIRNAWHFINADWRTSCGGLPSRGLMVNHGAAERAAHFGTVQP